MGPGYYANLQSKLKKSSGLNPAASQVELDLLRTLPNNKHYENMSAEGIPKLRNVLLSYTLHNPQIGYCQVLINNVSIKLLYIISSSNSSKVKQSILQYISLNLATFFCVGFEQTCCHCFAFP